jgi:hypothetical protein
MSTLLIEKVHILQLYTFNIIIIIIIFIIIIIIIIIKVGTTFRDFRLSSGIWHHIVW